jgi:hypothetical protein
MAPTARPEETGLLSALRQPPSSVSYHVRVLADCHAIKLIRTRPARGSVRHFYRSTVWALQVLGLGKLSTGGEMNKTEGRRTTWAEDEGVESAVLHQMLDLHPTQLTLAELRRELMGGDRGSFAERDAVERAVRDLAAVGLLHQGEDFVAPTRAALRFSELLDR